MDKKRKSMQYSFKKLFKMMLDKGIGKKELADAAGISYSSLSRLANNQMIQMDSLIAICRVLECGMDDILEYEEIVCDTKEVQE